MFLSMSLHRVVFLACCLLVIQAHRQSALAPVIDKLHEARGVAPSSLVSAAGKKQPYARSNTSTGLHALEKFLFHPGTGAVLPKQKLRASRNKKLGAVTNYALVSNYAPDQTSRGHTIIDSMHFIARRAILDRRFHDAGRCYNILLQSPATATPRTFMLKALLQQRQGLVEDARKTFRAGFRAWKRRAKVGESLSDKDLHEEAQLLQAWGLMESKHGKLDLASYLVNCAVSLDSSLRGVLGWKIFREFRSKYQA
jgi:hypothetical protein